MRRFLMLSFHGLYLTAESALRRRLEENDIMIDRSGYRQFEIPSRNGDVAPS